MTAEVKVKVQTDHIRRSYTRQFREEYKLNFNVVKEVLNNFTIIYNIIILK
jgi:hypothetical protein